MRNIGTQVLLSWQLSDRFVDICLELLAGQTFNDCQSLLDEETSKKKDDLL